MNSLVREDSSHKILMKPGKVNKHKHPGRFERQVLKPLCGMGQLNRISERIEMHIQFEDLLMIPMQK